MADAAEEGADDLPDALALGGGRYQVQGTARLDALGELLGVALDHPEVNGVSGLILSELGRPARIGDRLCWQGVRLEVCSLHGRGVGRALVRREPEAPSTEPAV